jgi:hypothetical protein
LVFELTAHRPMLHRQYCAMESPILKNQQVFPQTAKGVPQQPLSPACG